MGGALHIVMLPWLAMGHLIPFLELSRRLAKKGHFISFLTTKTNFDRLLPAIPPHLSPLINLVELHLPALDGAHEIENTVDLTSDDLRPHLHTAFNAFRTQLSSYLRNLPPTSSLDWIVYDFSAPWALAVGAEFGVPCAYLSLFSAATLGFFGKGGGGRTAPEHFTTVPDWVPFPTTVAFKPHEAREIMKAMRQSNASDSNSDILGRCSIVCVRSCGEMEGEWLELLGKLYDVEVVPIGLFPPSPTRSPTSATWAAWLDEQEPGSVVYAAFGSEARLTSEQLGEIALGLESSGLPFIWAIRESSSSSSSLQLPEGFEERNSGGGVVVRGWMPQAWVLGHRSVGGFLTHGGWNSVVEGLTAGAVMVVLPLLFDQGLNARLLADKGMGLEVERRDEDGSFNGEEIARKLRLVMVDEEGERWREKARHCGEVLGDEELNDGYIDGFVEKLYEHKKHHSSLLEK